MTTTNGVRVLAGWTQFLDILQNQRKVNLKGDSLTIPSLCAISTYVTSYLSAITFSITNIISRLKSYNALVSIDELPIDTANRIDASVKFLEDRLAQGRSVYGMVSYLSH